MNHKSIPTIASIVEGDGEIFATPIVLKRIKQIVAPGTACRLVRPTRLSKGKMKSVSQLERHLNWAASALRNERGAVFVFLDADDDAECVLGPQIAGAAAHARGDIPVIVSVAKFEFETYFLAALESLRGVNGIPIDAAIPKDATVIRGAKEYLESLMGRKYSPTVDQPIFADAFDIQAARCVRSLDRLCGKLQGLLAASAIKRL